MYSYNVRVNSCAYYIFSVCMRVYVRSLMKTKYNNSNYNGKNSRNYNAYLNQKHEEKKWQQNSPLPPKKQNKKKYTILETHPHTFCCCTLAKCFMAMWVYIQAYKRVNECKCMSINGNIFCLFIGNCFLVFDYSSLEPFSKNLQWILQK